MKPGRSIILGCNGLVGSALTRLHVRRNLPYACVARADLDLRDSVAVDRFFRDNVTEHDTVFLAAAVVGGIEANRTRPVEFIQDNLAIQHNALSSTMKIGKRGPRRFVFLGSVCIYPRACGSMISENDILTGPLEPTNKAYAMAKLSGLTACQAYHDEFGLSYVAPMPTNLYGPFDNYHPKWSHAIPGLLHRMHRAKMSNEKVFTCWGSGTAQRQFMYVDDLASAITDLASTDFVGHVNVAPSGIWSINQVTQMIYDMVGFRGDLNWDYTKPDGAPMRSMDTSLFRSLLPKWKETMPLPEGLVTTYESYLNGEGRFIQET